MHRSFSALALLLLTACSSLPPGQSAKLRALDPVTDDVASLLVAFDLPLSVEPIPGASTLSISYVGDTTLMTKAVLAETDPGDLAGTLPPPADGRNYFLLGFSLEDQQALRTAQAVARAQPRVKAIVQLAPKFCRTMDIDPATIRVSALVALPSAAALAPLLSNEPLVTLLATGPIRDLPACQGHSV